MTIKGFFFDLDGTLVDTHESNFLAYHEAVKDVHGVALGKELKQRIKAGESSDAFLRGLITGISDTTVAAINAKKKELYPKHLHVSKLNEFLSIFLQQMSEHYVTALVTTAKQKNAKAVLETHDLEKYFSFCIFGEDVGAMKPAPEAYLLALQKANLHPNEVIAFEDSQKGIEAATSAGIQVVHIRNFL